MKERIKTISKYLTNILGMISAIILGLNSCEGIDIPFTTTIIEVIAVFQGVIGTYLISGKLFSNEDLELAEESEVE